MEMETKEDHPIFSNDPSYWMSLVHKLVHVTTEDGEHHTGYVYTVDPVSESILLMDQLKPEDSSAISLQIILGHSVTKVETLSTSTCEDIKEVCDRLFRPSTDRSLSRDEILNRRTKLKSWLEKHRIPVSIGGYDGESLNVLSDALIIQSPFTTDNCLSNNEIVLAKIQALVKAMPKDCI